MKIKSTKFIKGIVEDDEILGSDIPQIAFIGRSNVGKSSLINALTGSDISRISATPGSTQQINIFLINDKFYFVDLPGYGYAQASGLGKEKIGDLIESYLFMSTYTQKKIVFIVDVNVGMTDKDVSMFQELQNNHKDFIIVLSKMDKLKQSEAHRKLNEIKKITGSHKTFPVSVKTKKGLKELLIEILD